MKIRKLTDAQIERWNQGRIGSVDDVLAGLRMTFALCLQKLRETQHPGWAVQVERTGSAILRGEEIRMMKMASAERPTDVQKAVTELIEEVSAAPSDGKAA